MIEKFPNYLSIHAGGILISERPLNYHTALLMMPKGFPFKKYFHGMLDAGVYLAPSQFEAGFISTAHSAEDIDRTVAAAAKVMKSL